MNFATLSKFVKNTQERAQEQLEVFTREVATNPAYALEWRNPVEYAAKLHVCAYITEWFERAGENGADPEAVAAGVIQHAIGETFRIAEQTNQSTSPQANMMERHKLAVWATIASKAFDKARFSNEPSTHTVIFKSVPSNEAGSM